MIAPKRCSSGTGAGAYEEIDMGLRHSAGEPEDEGRSIPPGPNRAVRVHQQAGKGLSGAMRAADLDEYEEEGTLRRQATVGST